MVGSFSGERLCWMEEERDFRAGAGAGEYVTGARGSCSSCLTSMAVEHDSRTDVWSNLMPDVDSLWLRTSSSSGLPAL